MVGRERTWGGLKLSHTNTMAPFYDELKKKKKEEEQLKKNAQTPRKTVTNIIEKDNIKVFQLPKIKNI